MKVFFKRSSIFQLFIYIFRILKYYVKFSKIYDISSLSSFQLLSLSPPLKLRYPLKFSDLSISLIVCSEKLTFQIEKKQVGVFFCKQIVICKENRKKTGEYKRKHPLSAFRQLRSAFLQNLPKILKILKGNFNREIFKRIDIPFLYFSFIFLIPNLHPGYEIITNVEYIYLHISFNVYVHFNNILYETLSLSTKRNLKNSRWKESRIYEDYDLLVYS